MKRLLVLLSVLLFLFSLQLIAQTAAPSPQAAPAEKPRVFVTSSQSWEVRGGGGGANGAWGSGGSGGARPQTAEIIKTFGERCPNTMVNNIETKANYIVVLDHEGGKGLLSHKNKVAVFEHFSGDVIVSKSTLSLGGSVQEACEAITKHWSENSAKLISAAEKALAPPPAAPSAPAAAPVAPARPSISVTSTPASAEIEIDGSYVGSTPSSVELEPGEHTVVVSKKGFKSWQRKMKVSGGQIRVDAELEAGQ